MLAAARPVVAASPDAFAQLAQAMRARVGLAYTARQIVDIVSPNPLLGSTHLVADIVRDGHRSRVIYQYPADVAGRMMADDGTRTEQYEPGRAYRLVGVSQSRQEETQTLPKMLTLLRRNYSCVRLRREPLAGRTCDVLELLPRRENGPHKLFWVDKTTHAILRTEEYDADGCRLNVSAYETIRFVKHIAPEELGLPSGVRGLPARSASPPPQPVADAERAFAQAGLAGHRPAWLPPGYAQLGSALVVKPDGGKAVLLRYSDGLQTLTVFEESAQNLPPPAHHRARLNRGLARYGRQAWASDEGKIRLSIVGDLTLPDTVGLEMLRALALQSEPKLRQAMAQAFGADAAARARRLHQRGWGYDEIAALHLCLRAHPSWASRVRAAWAGSPCCPGFAAVWETPARLWIARTLQAAP